MDSCGYMFSFWFWNDLSEVRICMRKHDRDLVNLALIWNGRMSALWVMAVKKNVRTNSLEIWKGKDSVLSRSVVINSDMWSETISGFFINCIGEKLIIILYYLSFFFFVLFQFSTLSIGNNEYQWMQSNTATISLGE